MDQVIMATHAIMKYNHVFTERSQVNEIPLDSSYVASDVSVPMFGPPLFHCLVWSHITLKIQFDTDDFQPFTPVPCQAITWTNTAPLETNSIAILNKIFVFSNIYTAKWPLGQDGRHTTDADLKVFKLIKTSEFWNNFCWISFCKVLGWDNGFVAEFAAK